MFDPRHFGSSPLLDQAIKNVATEVELAIRRRTTPTKGADNNRHPGSLNARGLTTRPSRPGQVR
jgi:hypothetical protein